MLTYLTSQPARRTRSNRSNDANDDDPKDDLKDIDGVHSMGLIELIRLGDCCIVAIQVGRRRRRQVESSPVRAISMSSMVAAAAAPFAMFPLATPQANSRHNSHRPTNTTRISLVRFHSECDRFGSIWCCVRSRWRQQNGANAISMQASFELASELKAAGDNTCAHGTWAPATFKRRRPPPPKLLNWAQPTKKHRR